VPPGKSMIISFMGHSISDVIALPVGCALLREVTQFLHNFLTPPSLR
jgi:hypothetical protein